MEKDVWEIVNVTMKEETQTIGTEFLTQHILRQKDLNQPRKKLPDALNFFPVRSSRILQKLVLKLLDLFSRDQRNINTVTIGTFDQLLNLYQLMRQDIQILKKQIAVLPSAAIDQVYKHVSVLESHQRASEVLLRNELLSLRRKLENSDLTGSPGLPSSKESQKKSASEPSVSTRISAVEGFAPFYLEYHAAMRGARQDIIRKYEVYLSDLERNALDKNNDKGKKLFLDLGCGRGEWLELLQNTGYKGVGIEASAFLAELCRNNGFDVRQGDILLELRKQPSEAFDGVSGFNLMERLPFPDLLEVLDEIRRVLKPGGILIFETPNPENMKVATSQFLQDPYGVKLVPSSLAKFAAESRGFHRVTVREMNQVSQEKLLQGGSLAERFNEYFHNSQDYALIGFRP